LFCFLFDLFCRTPILSWFGVVAWSNISNSVAIPPCRTPQRKSHLCSLLLSTNPVVFELTKRSRFTNVRWLLISSPRPGATAIGGLPQPQVLKPPLPPPTGLFYLFLLLLPITALFSLLPFIFLPSMAPQFFLGPPPFLFSYPPFYLFLFFFPLLSFPSQKTRHTWMRTYVDWFPSSLFGLCDYHPVRVPTLWSTTAVTFVPESFLFLHPHLPPFFTPFPHQHRRTLLFPLFSPLL